MIARLNRDLIKISIEKENELISTGLPSYQSMEDDIEHKKGENIVRLFVPMLQDMLDPSYQFNLYESLKSIRMKFRIDEEDCANIEFTEFRFKQGPYTDIYWSKIWKCVRLGTHWKYLLKDGKFILSGVTVMNPLGIIESVNVQKGETVIYPWEEDNHRLYGGINGIEELEEYISYEDIGFEDIENYDEDCDEDCDEDLEEWENLDDFDIHKDFGQIKDLEAFVANMQDTVLYKGYPEIGLEYNEQNEFEGYYADFLFINTDAFIKYVLDTGSASNTIKPKFHTDRDNHIFARIKYGAEEIIEALGIITRMEDYAHMLIQPSNISLKRCNPIYKDITEIRKELSGT